MGESLGIVLFLVALVLAIFFHEGGHYATAKLFGMKVERFFLGFGPTVWSFRRGETEYGIKALPLGGFCKIAGMTKYEGEGNPLEREPRRRGAAGPPPAAAGSGQAEPARAFPAPAGAEALSQTSAADESRNFYAKPAWQRAIVLMAGSITHFLVGLVLLYVVFALIGVPFASNRVDQVIPTAASGGPSPAALAGLHAGDRIVAVDGRRIGDFDQLRSAFHDRAGQAVTVRYERDGRSFDTQLTPVPVTDPDCTVHGFVGVAGRDVNRRYGIAGGVVQSGRTFGDLVVASFKGLGGVVSGFADRLRGPQVAPCAAQAAAQGGGGTDSSGGGAVGLIGISRLAGQAVAASAWAAFLLILIQFNVFVGIVNLLPLPPMDGGYLGFVVYERLTRREVDLRKVAPVALVIVGLLVVLTVGLLWLDVTSPISNPFR